MLKVMTIVGTRPEIIRLSRVIALLDRTVDHSLLHTGQNYDYALNEIFFEELEMRPPDHFLRVDTSSLGRVLGETLIGVEKVLAANRPDAVLILGDTNSGIAVLIAKRMRIPTYHMEAGNRCFDSRVPEEINRRMIDHIADFNLVYTEHARRNLLAEGIHPSKILLTGSPMREVLQHNAGKVAKSDVLNRESLHEGKYFLVSLHREENVDNPSRLRSALEGISSLSAKYGYPVMVSTHPRTRRRLDQQLDRTKDGIIFRTPFGFHDYLKLQQSAALVLSDSGTISEESALLGFPAITLRDSIERPEALEAGGIITAGTDSNNIEVAGATILEQFGAQPTLSIPSEYLIDDTSRRVVNFILSTARRKTSSSTEE